MIALKKCVTSSWKRVVGCLMQFSAHNNHHNIDNNIHHHHLEAYSSPAYSPPPPPINGAMSPRSDDDADLVSIKVCILGDPKIGKTSFLTKYVGREKEEGKGLNYQMDKTMYVSGARIAFSICEVQGTDNSQSHLQLACKDSVAMLFMFDLTSRCTLNSVINWYKEARKWNQSAMPVLVGTKFDDFVQLPLDLQWTIANQARGYAKALNATLFFSSTNYNINVNKIFKFIAAKLFNLPWSIERNLTIGEPIIDF
ncbi:septum-promoting GTP-binding protein 1-like [Heracleum sosnowskyi]|uniref:Septum-promoting GTP-binding protein 1-like n=1 Tax=Heracleum sosnowskyi TaxID=360622 RepID=A0AAD8J3V6_9APIA|nr:septum-promoting GTP-binding protein 1-like [Heracleum sosnowskyi]